MQIDKTPSLYPNPLFNIVDQIQLDRIHNLPLESKCLVYVKKQFDNLTDKRQHYPVMLQIHDEYVAQLCHKRQKLVSAFKCDYSHQFQIIRKPMVTAGKVPQLQGIRICLKDNPIPIECFIKPQAKISLDHFSKILAHKFIVQLGFHNLFKAIKKIGKGMTACVYNAQCYSTGKQVAIKSFRRSVYFTSENNNGQIAFKKQFKFLTNLNHKNICKFQGVYETQNSTYVIMELLPLSLYGYLQKYGFPSESKAKNIMKGLLQGINYLNKKGIMHRDLKLENIMVKKDPENPNQILPVIVDLGLAEYYDTPKYLYVRCGTPGYVAPEVLKIKSTDAVQTYTTKVDIFSLAVVFHILLFQKPIFEGKEIAEVVKKNCQCQIDFQNENFKILSQQGRDLFKLMLEKNPQDRISAEQALNHPYFTGRRLEIIGSIKHVLGQTSQTIPAAPQSSVQFKQQNKQGQKQKQ